MEIKFENYKLKDNTINFTINSKDITGIIGNSKEDILNIVNEKSVKRGKVLVDGKELNKEELLSLKKTISIADSNHLITFYNSIYEIMYYEIKRRNLSIKNPNKKIVDSLKIVGLDISILIKNINEISTSEKQLLSIALSLLSNPNIIILKEPLICLDRKNEKRLMILLQKLKDSYDKTIIILSEDSNILYQYTNHLIIAKTNKILIEGNSKDILERVDFLKRNRIPIPDIVEFTYLAKKNKKVKIDYHKDIRDIIKDIYKHV